MSKNFLNFELLFKLHHSYLCNVANRIINDVEASKDIVQEVFIKLWDKKDEIESIGNIKAYLFKATTNSSINHLLQKKKVTLFTEVVHNASANPLETLTLKELEFRIENSINGLPPKCKAIFVLSRFEGMKYREIAEHLDVSIKTVENQMGIALSKIRSDLRPYLSQEFMALVLSAGITLAGHLLLF